MKNKKYFLLFVHSKKADALSDEECIKKFLAGDEKFFSVIVEHHRPELFRYVDTCLHNKQQSEDVVQDVFLDFVLLLRSGNYAERGMVHHLLVKMAHHRVMDCQRHQQLHHALFIPPSENDERQSVPEEEETFKPNRRQMLLLRAFLRRMKERKRNVFMLRYHGKHYEEIGRVLHINPHTAMSDYTRTVRQMHKWLRGKE